MMTPDGTMFSLTTAAAITQLLEVNLREVKVRKGEHTKDIIRYLI
jgi:hypothetical protein